MLAAAYDMAALLAASSMLPPFAITTPALIAGNHAKLAPPVAGAAITAPIVNIVPKGSLMAPSTAFIALSATNPTALSTTLTTALI